MPRSNWDKTGAVSHRATATDILKVARDKWVSTQTIAEQVGISEPAAYRWVRHYLEEGFLDSQAGRRWGRKYRVSPLWGGKADQ